MIVSRTPLRISFLGGGTDYPAFYREHGGAVLSTTIDKYCWLTIRRLPPFFPHKNRIVYRTIETTETVEEIRHPTVKAVMKGLGLEGLEIHHDGDLPARSGMGTSSAFTVGLLHACHALLGERRTKFQLAREAIKIEQDVLKETVGCQDQVSASYGGFNRLTFGPQLYQTGSEFAVEPVPLPRWRMEEFERHLLLFFTGISRTAAEVAESYVPTLASSAHLAGAMSLLEAGVKVLCDLGPIEAFGELLHQAWMAKRALSEKVTDANIDLLYEAARESGAIGGKLLGAGGGGFLLLFARPDRQEEIRRRISGVSAMWTGGQVLEVHFHFESEGSKIVVYDP